MKIYDLAFQWQTLISGVIALAGAAATVVAVMMQINANRRIENERLKNEAYAARAVVPQALNELSEYAEQCMDIIDEASRDRSRVVPILAKLPQPPSNLLPICKDAIRFSDRERQKQLADLLSFFQVHEARLISIRNTSRPGHTFTTLPQAIIDSANLYALVSKLFPWARREEEGRGDRVSFDEIMQAIRIGVPHHESNAGLRIELDRRRPKAVLDPSGET